VKNCAYGCIIVEGNAAIGKPTW